MANRLFEYTLTGNQVLFVQEAEEQGLTVDYGYSGRGMFGRCCPAVRLGREQLIKNRFTASVESDNMGLGIVLYARF